MKFTLLFLIAIISGILFVDTASHQVKFKAPGGQVIIVVDTGKEGNSNGKSTNSSFSQPMGVCVEMDRNIFVTDAQAGTVKLITSIKGTIGFLKHVGLQYKAFLVHLNYQPTAKLSITEVIRHMEVLHSYLKEANKCVLDQLDTSPKAAGQHGTISHQTMSSVSMILKGL